MTKIPYLCSECGTKGVKLWREYSTFLSNITLKCRVCSEIEQAPALERKRNSTLQDIGTDQIGWRVPAVPDDTGTFWGVFSSVPQEMCDWWDALPDTNLWKKRDES